VSTTPISTSSVLMAWPAPATVQRCREAWANATPGERRQLTSLECNPSVFYLHAAEHLIVSRSSETEEREGRAAFRLTGLEWKLTPPRLLVLGADFCGAGDSMDFALGLCAKTLDECLELVQQAKSGRVGFDTETNCLMSGRSGTWEQHAGDFWTLVVHDICLHLEEATSRARCIGNVMAALAKPPPSARRSWPSKQTFAELKSTWARLDVEERVRMTMLSPNEYWFVQACDSAMVAATLLACKRESLRMNVSLLRNAREQSRIIANMDVRVDTGAVMLSSKYVMDPNCLDELHRKSMWHATEKLALVRLALCCRYEGLFEEGRPAIVADVASTWVDVERVVSTLVIESMLQRMSIMRKAVNFLLHHEALTEEAAEKAARLKREKQLAKRGEARERKAALLRAEKDRALAELARERAELARQEAEERRVAAEEARRAQEELRVVAEVERRLHEERRAEEKRSTLTLLARAPSWDLSCLRVCRTFLDYHELEEPVLISKEW
jgi:hypothetical protein